MRRFINVGVDPADLLLPPDCIDPTAGIGTPLYWKDFLKLGQFNPTLTNGLARNEYVSLSFAFEASSEYVDEHSYSWSDVPAMQTNMLHNPPSRRIYWGQMQFSATHKPEGFNPVMMGRVTQNFLRQPGWTFDPMYAYVVRVWQTDAEVIVKLREEKVMEFRYTRDNYHAPRYFNRFSSTR